MLGVLVSQGHKAKGHLGHGVLWAEWTLGQVSEGPGELSGPSVGRRHPLPLLLTPPQPQSRRGSP